MFALSDFSFNLVYASASPDEGSSGMGSSVVQGHNTVFWAPENYGQTYLHDRYSHVRVVGASVRISYVGAADEEAGMLVGAHLRNTSITGVTNRLIEEGEHVVRSRPHQGLRLSYSPHSAEDYNWTELNTRVVFNGADVQDVIGPGTLTTTNTE